MLFAPLFQELCKIETYISKDINSNKFIRTVVILTTFPRILQNWGLNFQGY